jgi:hypothetical protein
MSFLRHRSREFSIIAAFPVRKVNEGFAFSHIRRIDSGLTDPVSSGKTP